MRQDYRIRVLARILKNAGYMSDLVDNILSRQKQTNPIKENTYRALNISLGPGTSVMVPQNPIKPDGSVDFIISFKAIGNGDTSGAGRMGTNAVVISAYLPDKINKETRQVRFASYRKYGKSFVNNAIGTVLAALKKRYPNKNIHKGKLAVMWWSGGYTAGQQILQEMPEEVDAAISIDGMHSGHSEDSKNRLLSPFVQYAEMAKQDPNKKFIMISTGVEPGTYASTAETAKYVSQQAGLDTSMKTPSDMFVGNNPSGISSSNGLAWIQYAPPGKYSLKDMKKQHSNVYRWGRDNVGRMLGWN